MMDSLVDLMTSFMKVLFEKDEIRKAELKKKFDEEDGPKFFSLLEKRTADGWLYGSKVTYVDIAFWDISQRLPAEVFAKYPGLKSVKENVEALPNIAQWIKNRPVTQF